MTSRAKLNEPAKLLLLAALLAKDQIISNNSKAFLKELILRRDSKVSELLEKFETKEADNTTFIDGIHDLIEEEAHSVYNDLFVDCSLEVGKTLSKEERENKQLNEEKSLIYGEVDFHSFYRVLRKINPAPGGVFYDLGSGTGKALFAARLVCDFSRCIGIEILEALHQQAAKIVHRYNEDFRELLSAGMHQMANVYVGSFLEFDWSDGDVVFANSTCFDDSLMASMGELAKFLKPGAIFVTFTKGLNLPKHFEVLERKRYRMSWGPATVFIHRRLGPDGKPVGLFKLNLLPSDDKSYSDEEDSNERQRNASALESDEDDDDDDDYEDDYESEDDEEGDENGDDDGDDDDDGEEDTSEDDNGNDNQSSDSGNEYGLGNEQQYNPYAPQRSYYNTAAATKSYPTNYSTSTSTPNIYDTPGYNYQLKVNPSPKTQKSGLPAGLGSPQDAALLRRKNRSAGSRQVKGG